MIYNVVYSFDLHLHLICAAAVLMATLQYKPSSPTPLTLLMSLCGSVGTWLGQSTCRCVNITEQITRPSCTQNYSITRTCDCDSIEQLPSLSISHGCLITTFKKSLTTLFILIQNYFKGSRRIHSHFFKSDLTQY